MFRATAGLQQRFGAERVMDTPLSELLISGLASAWLRKASSRSAKSSLWVHLSLHRSTGEPCLPPAQPDAGAAQLPDGVCARRMAPASAPPSTTRKHRVDVRPYSGLARGDTVLAGTRLRLAARRHPRPGSGDVPGAHAHLPRRRNEVEDNGEALPLDVAFVLREGAT